MSTITKYKVLLNQFVSGEVSAPHFEAAFLEMFKNESSIFPEDIYDVLNNLFIDVDAYCGDESLRDDNDLDDKGLLASAKVALDKLP